MHDGGGCNVALTARLVEAHVDTGPVVIPMLMEGACEIHRISYWNGVLVACNFKLLSSSQCVLSSVFFFFFLRSLVRRICRSHLAK